MNYKFRYTITVIALLFIIYIVGPRVDLSYTIESVNISNDIDQYLFEKESQFSDIKKGTEKKIIWAKPDSPGITPFSIVYLHGFSASRQEVAPLSDLLAKQFSFNLFYTRLTGHGRSSAAMKEVTVNALLNDANEALEIGKRIGDKVILIGSSTGGSLASWLASENHKDAIAAIVMLSPNFGLKRKESEIILHPWGQNILNLVEGDEYHFSPVNELQEKYWTTRYPSSALLSMMGIVDLTRKIDFNNIKVPSMILYSEKDKIIDIDDVNNRYEQLGSARKEFTAINYSTDPQQHILAGNILSPDSTDQLVEKISSFLNPIVSQ